jgi:hypothetical protein
MLKVVGSVKSLTDRFFAMNSITEIMVEIHEHYECGFITSIQE